MAKIIVFIAAVFDAGVMKFAKGQEVPATPEHQRHVRRGVAVEKDVADPPPPPVAYVDADGNQIEGEEVIAGLVEEAKLSRKKWKALSEDEREKLLKSYLDAKGLKPYDPNHA